jgi:hypothetical protein
MDFLVSQTHINPFYLIFIGFIIGILGGFFGVGGSFLAGPALFAVGVPMNFVVGTDLAHIVGKSIVAAKKHRALGNVDLKLGLIMVAGTIAGVEVGAQGIEGLKHFGQTLTGRGISFVIVLILFRICRWESWQTIKMQRDRAREAEMSGIRSETEGKEDESAFEHIARKILRQHPADDQAAGLELNAFRGRLCWWRSLEASSAGSSAMGRDTYECRWSGRPAFQLILLSGPICSKLSSPQATAPATQSRERRHNRAGDAYRRGNRGPDRCGVDGYFRDQRYASRSYRSRL